MFDGDTIETAVGRCRLKRSDRRTLAISVLPSGTVELVAPHDAKQEAIAAKVKKRLRWIATQRRTFAEMNQGRVEPVFVNGATHRYLGRQYRLKVRVGTPTQVKLTGAYFHVTTRTSKPEQVRELLTEWYRGKAIDQFTARLAGWRPWCHSRDLPKPRLKLLRMPKRWGSSHRDGRIFLNPLLLTAPSICIDYVIAHEICHLRHPLHDPAFFRLLSQLLPDWRNVKARLEQFQ